MMPDIRRRSLRMSFIFPPFSIVLLRRSGEMADPFLSEFAIAFSPDQFLVHPLAETTAYDPNTSTQPSANLTSNNQVFIDQPFADPNTSDQLFIDLTASIYPDAFSQSSPNLTASIQPSPDPTASIQPFTDCDTNASIQPSADPTVSIQPFTDTNPSIQPSADPTASIQPFTDTNPSIQLSADSTASIQPFTDTNPSIQLSADENSSISLLASTNDIAQLPTDLIVSPTCKKNLSTRFAPIVSDEEVKAMRVRAIPKNTRKTTNWANTVWIDWAEYRQRIAKEDEEESSFPSALINQMTKTELNYWLSHFVVEVRRKDGELYPPNTLYQICCGLQRTTRETNPHRDIIVGLRDRGF